MQKGKKTNTDKRGNEEERKWIKYIREQLEKNIFISGNKEGRMNEAE